MAIRLKAVIDGISINNNLSGQPSVATFDMSPSGGTEMQFPISPKVIQMFTIGEIVNIYVVTDLGEISTIEAAVPIVALSPED